MPSRPRAGFGVTPFTSITDDLVPPATTVVGIGESAHFVTEFALLRADLVTDLVRHHGVTRLALEIGHDEAPAIESWLRDSTAATPCPVGPLTARLYGTFLTELRERLGGERPLTILGVDLPNSLTLTPTLDPLAAVLDELDPPASGLLGRARELATPVRGASAAAAAAAWSHLAATDRDELTALLARLVARVDALGAARSRPPSDASWRRARDLTGTALTTSLVLHGMAELFAGTGLDADTTLRERFVASRLVSAAAELPAGERIAYVAHNNHIQRAPVVFGGEVVAYPAGLLAARSLGDAYVCLGLSHLDGEVPEMIVPAETPLGFHVERVAASPLTDRSVEAATDAAGTPATVRCTTDTEYTIRSQSATASVPAEAFDAVIVVATAATDPASVGT